MVCDACEKKQSKVIVPDKWKSGARNTNESGGRIINENKALSSRARYNPVAQFAKCRICKQRVHVATSYYCQSCAYKKGICSGCGKKMLETKNYVQSSV